MVTGIDEVATGDTAKKLQLLKQAVPTMSRVAVLGRNYFERLTGGTMPFTR